MSYKRPPEEWATDGAAMTSPQRGHLYYLGLENAVHIPFVDNREWGNTQEVTMAEASILITMLRSGKQPSPAFIDGLGRNTIPYDPPAHPEMWRDPYAPATQFQLSWLTQLISLMGVPSDVMHDTLAWVTRGHASLLIDRLKYYRRTGWMRTPLEGRLALFEEVLALVEEELPLLLEELETTPYEGVIKMEDGSEIQNGAWAI